MMKVYFQDTEDESNEAFRNSIQYRIDRIERESTPKILENQRGGATNSRVSRNVMELALKLEPGEVCFYVTTSANICRVYRRIDFPDQIELAWNSDD